uniref:Uncharacterized protein n=1 Tax=Acrobeloides nanus TaxID=290746 RepID=A0A914DZW9_9BILA
MVDKVATVRSGKLSNVETTRAFCRAYRHHCPTTAEEMTRNPFHILADRETPDFPDIEKVEQRLIID